MTRITRRTMTVLLGNALLDEARCLNVDVSQAAEDGLRDAVKRARNERWKRDNADAMAEYNEFVRRHGILLSEYRKF